MTVLLVLATFIVLLTIDFVLSRKNMVRSAGEAARAAAVLRPGRPLVGGFAVPEGLRYHPGHTWALSESPTLVRVGLDDFAARLIGKLEKVTLPRRGQWIRQGQKLWTVQRDGRQVEMLSPIEGTVASVNEALGRDPDLARRDPYGEGWLVTVEAPDLRTNLKNLLVGSLARSWMEDAAARLRGRLPAPAGPVAQDGGVGVEDLGSQIPEEAWSDLAREYFLA